MCSYFSRVDMFCKAMPSRPLDHSSPFNWSLTPIDPHGDGDSFNYLPSGVLAVDANELNGVLAGGQALARASVPSSSLLGNRKLHEFEGTRLTKTNYYEVDSWLRIRPVRYSTKLYLKTASNDGCWRVVA